MAFSDAPHKVKEAEKSVVSKITAERESAFNRFPLTFTLLATFGVVMTFYGLEHLIDKIDWLSNNPIVTFAVGVGVLILTGSLYKKL